MLLCVYLHLQTYIYIYIYTLRIAEMLLQKLLLIREISDSFYDNHKRGIYVIRHWKPQGIFNYQTEL